MHSLRLSWCLARFALGLLVTVAPVSPAAAFDWGIQVDPPDPSASISEFVDTLKSAGINAVRLGFPVKDTLGISSDPDHPLLSFASELEKKGIRVYAIVGNGFQNSLPEGLSPGAIWDSSDQEVYTDFVASNVSAVTSALSAHGVSRFQVENELNAAGFATLWPYQWRSGSAWWSAHFKQELIASLSTAVVEASPAAFVYTNFHDIATDFLPAEVFSLWWSPWIDSHGVDFYPNYFLPWPPLGWFLKYKNKYFGWVTGKPILTAETGYPSKGYAHQVWFQHDFVNQVADAAYESSTGILYFRLSDPAPPAWTPDPDDAVEPYFGLLDHEGKPKEGKRVVWTGWWFSIETVVPWEAYQDKIAEKPE